MEQSFDDFVKDLSRLGGVVQLDQETYDFIREVVSALDANQGEVTRKHLLELISAHPTYVPVLGLCVRLSQEQMKNLLRHRFGISSWNKIAVAQPAQLIEYLDIEFDLVREINTQRKKAWTFSDILSERFASRLRAAGSIQRGRRLEDDVQQIIDQMGLPRQMRTRFLGRGGRSAPCDLAIPGSGQSAQIVCGIKGFDSTGSKLTDAAREIEEMATIRLPTQYIFAVVDGVGWLSRQADLRRIYMLYQNRSIDGLYTRNRLSKFQEDLAHAAVRLNLSAEQ